MSISRSLAAALATALLLTACAGDDVPDSTDPGVEQPTDDQTDGEDEPAEEPGDEDQTDGEDDQDAAGDDDQDAAGDDDAAAGDTQPATVALSFDGQGVPIADACNGVDGAVLATTEGEVTITLVQEEGTALRYQAEGLMAETDEVEVEEIGASTIYRATLESEQVPAVDVEMEVSDTSVLDDC